MGKFLVVLLIAAASTSLMGAAISCGFEDQGTNTTGLSTATTACTGGVNATVTRQGGATFGFSNLAGSVLPAAGWGSHTLSPFENTNAGTALVLTFDTVLTSFSIQVGDFDGDTDDAWTITAFSGVGGSGSNLGSASGVWGALDISQVLPQTGTISAAGIRSVVLVGGGAAFPMSLYWDNVSANTVPEPATWLLMAGGCALFGALRKRA